MSVITCQSPAGQLRMLGWLGSRCQNLGLEVVQVQTLNTGGVAESCHRALTSRQAGSLCGDCGSDSETGTFDSSRLSVWRHG